MNARPFLFQPGNDTVRALARVDGAPVGQSPQLWLRGLLHANPALLPVDQFGSFFAPLVSVGCGIDTGEGALDNLFVSVYGRLILVMIESPPADGRQPRDLVDLLLKHGRRIARWSNRTLRDAASGLGFDGRLETALADTAVSPPEFEDSLGKGLEKADFLLLIVGERISTDVLKRVHEVQVARGVGITLGLIEVPLFQSGSAEQATLLAVPRAVGPSLATYDLRNVLDAAVRQAYIRPQVVSENDPWRRPWSHVLLTTFHDPTSCREFHDRLRGAGINFRTRVRRKSADVEVSQIAAPRARQLLAEYEAQHPDMTREGFQITYDYAIFGALIAGAFAMITMAVEFRDASDLILPVFLTGLGGMVGWVLEKGRVHRRLTGVWHVSTPAMVVAIFGVVLGLLLFLGRIAR